MLPQNTPAVIHTPAQITGQITQILVTFEDLHRHGDFTAAALALGDMWLLLPTRQNVTHLARQLSQTSNIWPAFDDLMQHDEYTAAALAFGDVWLALPTDARAQVVQAVKEAVTNGR